jgi:hypothetical protein
MRDKSSGSQSVGSKIWQAHLHAWEKSGLSGAEYCRQHTLSYHAFTYWKRKNSIRQEAAHFVSVPALRITQKINNHSAALKVDLGNSIKIEIYDDFAPSTLRRVVAALGGQ